LVAISFVMTRHQSLSSSEDSATSSSSLEESSNSSASSENSSNSSASSEESIEESYHSHESEEVTTVIYTKRQTTKKGKSRSHTKKQTPKKEKSRSRTKKQSPKKEKSRSRTKKRSTKKSKHRSRTTLENSDTLFIIENNDRRREGSYKYTVRRIAKGSFDKMWSSHRVQHPNAEVIYEINSLNAKNLWKEVRIKLVSKGRIKINGIHFNLVGSYSIRKLIQCIEKQVGANSQ
jgi:hypothetical protein